LKEEELSTSVQDKNKFHLRVAVTSMRQISPTNYIIGTWALIVNGDGYRPTSGCTRGFGMFPSTRSTLGVSLIVSLGIVNVDERQLSLHEITHVYMVYWLSCEADGQEVRALFLA
jgi:hypothetical protein